MNTQQKTQFIKENYNSMTDEAMGSHLGISSDAVYRLRKKNKLFKHKPQETPGDLNDAPSPKYGLEVRGDHIVINWTTKTIITELGEFGQMVCSFDMHSAVQRSYVTMGENETAAMVAMKFDFPHAKAVQLYAKHHGFTKSSLPQTDLEFELGLSEDEAVAQNIQTMKRNSYKKTEKAKWMEIQKGYDKWINFHHNVLKPFENHIEQYLPRHKSIAFKNIKAPKTKIASVVGSSDLHFMKQCYDAFGKEIYNRDIAVKAITTNIQTLLTKKIQSGIPEKFFITVGGDDLHIDNTLQTTTRGTPQANSTDGSYRIALGAYFDMTIATIDMFSQISDVELIITPGNHNEHTAYVLGEALKRYYALKNTYEKCNKVNVIVRFHERIYVQYGVNCFIFNHMSKMSLTKTKRELHKLILAEARSQGIDVGSVKNYTMFGQHLHHDLQEDLGGMVELVVFMSLSEEDDWHQDSGYIGAKKKLAMYNYDLHTGKDSVIYS